VHPPLYGDREKEVPCQSGDVNLVKGDRKALLSPTVRGTARLRLSNVTHLKLKGLIRIDGIRPDRSEVLAIASIDKHSATDQPTWVTLDWPLAFDHQAEASIERLDSQWERPQHTLVLDGHRGESCVLLDSIEGFRADVYIKIGDGSGAKTPEYHRIAVFRTASDNDGRYRFPPLQRVAQVSIIASEGSRRVECKWQPDYSLPMNQVDLILKSS
jgi:hypothetical protein